MTNLKTKYLGLDLKNPLVASSSALSKKLVNIKKMEGAGIACVVLFSLFEEEIQHESLALDYFLSRGTESFAEALSYFPDFDHYNIGPEDYLKLISKAKKSVNIPIIASLNGISSGGWINYAKKIENAGADALELNIYFLQTHPDVSSNDLEKAYLELIKDVRESVKIPVAVKLGPYFTSLPYSIKRMVDMGANGLVLFNRFYQPDLDIENMSIEPKLELSTSSDLLLPLRWTAILYKNISADIALSSGIHTGFDMVKALLAGATVTMTASELVAHGVESASTILDEFTKWMDTHGYESVESMRGILSQQSISNPAAFERANYMKALTLFDNKMG